MPAPVNQEAVNDLVGLLTDAVFAEFLAGMKKAREPQDARTKEAEAPRLRG